MSRDRRRRLARMVWYGFLAVLCVPVLFPTWWMVTSSLKPVSEIFAEPPSLLPLSPTLAGYREAFTFQPLARQYLNSAYIAAVVTAGTVVVASMAGYAFARIRFRGHNQLFLVVLMGLLLPSEVTVIPLFRLFLRIGLLDTHWPLILVPVFGAPSVFPMFIMRQFFVTLPIEVEEAGWLDGLGRLGTFWHIALPLARPALGAAAIVSFLHSWNMYLEPVVFLSTPGKYTLPQALTQFVDSYAGPLWGAQLAAATCTALPVLVVFALAQRAFVEGLAHTGYKG